jgi:hypothetical protein
MVVAWDFALIFLETFWLLLQPQNLLILMM